MGISPSCAVSVGACKHCSNLLMSRMNWLKFSLTQLSCGAPSWFSWRNRIPKWYPLASLFRPCSWDARFYSAKSRSREEVKKNAITLIFKGHWSGASSTAGIAYQVGAPTNLLYMIYSHLQHSHHPHTRSATHAPHNTPNLGQRHFKHPLNRCNGSDGNNYVTHRVPAPHNWHQTCAGERVCLFLSII